MIRTIIFLVFLLILSGLCQKVVNNHKNFLPNHQDCGLRSINSSDIRTLHPWTVAVYTRASSRSPWKYFVTGAVISPTAVITIFGGGFGQPPPGDSGKKYKLPSPKNVMVAGGLITTDLAEADANSQYATVSYIASCSNSSKQNNEDYHFAIIRLGTPFDITTPYVRPACVPFVMQYFYENFGISRIANIHGIQSGFYSPYGRGFYSLDRKVGPTYASIFAYSISYDTKKCENYIKFYYKGSYKDHADDIACGSFHPDGLDNYTCPTYGNAGLWESTRFVIPFVPSFGPIPRFFLFGLAALTPRQDKGLCNLSALGIGALLRSAFDYIRGHLICPPTTFPCTYDDRCIEVSSVCDGIRDCQNGEDEDPTFCRATSKCDLEKEYQCGLYGNCIEKTRIHDGNKDCPSGSDESPKVPKPKVPKALEISGRKFVEPSQPLCDSFQLPEGVVATCTDASGKAKNCTLAAPGTDITLTCAPYYSPAQRATSIKRTCYEDLKWKPVRSFSCETECGLWGTDLLSVGFIANGKQVEYATRFPWHALIFRETFFGSEDFEYVCGGSMIERNIIVTAAHCTVDARGVPLKPQLLKIVMNAPSADFKDNDRNEGTQIFQVEQIWHPSSFDYRTLQSDIAIVHLKTPATYNNYVRPICYLLDKIQRPPGVNSTGKVPGFGLDKNGELSVDLQYIEVNVTKNDDCGFESSSDKLCAKASISGASLCYGDSGGGMIFPTKNKRYGAHVLKGIVSTKKKVLRTQCGHGDSASSFTYVDYFTEWILSIIEEIDTNPDS